MVLSDWLAMMFEKDKSEFRISAKEALFCFELVCNCF